MIEGAAFKDQDFVLVAQAQEALHFIGVHRPFAEEGEDRKFPDSERSRHIVHVNYIERAIFVQAIYRFARTSVPNALGRFPIIGLERLGSIELSRSDQRGV